MTAEIENLFRQWAFEVAVSFKIIMKSAEGKRCAHAVTSERRVQSEPDPQIYPRLILVL